MIKEVNGSTTKLKSSTIVMNDKNQTLDVVFNEMETTVADNLSSAKLYADGKLSDAQKYALEQANSALSSAKSYADSAVDNIEVGGRNLILNSAFKKSRKEWTDWGNPTTREIISSNGKMWAHIVGNKQIIKDLTNGLQREVLKREIISLLVRELKAVQRIRNLVLGFIG